MESGSHNSEDRKQIRELELELAELRGDISRLRKTMARAPAARRPRMGPIDVGEK
jgi:hypothetical protein